MQALDNEIFRIQNYEDKVKFDKIWGYQNKGISLQRGCQNSNFLTTHAKQMKFSE